jgi:hypothetical protein
MASRAPYASERKQHDDDGDWKRGVERPSWNPRHPLQDVRRNQAGKEEGRNSAPDNSVPLIKVFAHRFHGARFYALLNAAQCLRQVVRALCWLIYADATLWAYAWPTVEDRRGLKYKVGTTTRAHVAEGEYANDANGEKRENGHPTVIGEPGMGSPTPGQYADGHQARPQKQVPGSQ